MAKIDRYNGNMEAFAADALSTERTIFGDTAQSDTLDDNITTNFLRGWEIVGVNENPTKQDFNGLAFTLGQLISYLHQRGIAEWNAAQEYFDGSVVTTLVGIYRLKSDGVGSSNPDTDSGVNWELIPTRAEVDAKADQDTTYTKTEVDELRDELLDAIAAIPATPAIPDIPDFPEQTWQDVTSSRSRYHTYTNSTCQPITATITVNPDPSNTYAAAYVDETLVFHAYIPVAKTITFIIPVGSTYSFEYGTTDFVSWAELR